MPKFDPFARPFVHSTMTDLRTRAERPDLIWTAMPMDWDFLLLDEMTQPGIPVGSYPMMTPTGGEMWTIPDEFK